MNKSDVLVLLLATAAPQQVQYLTYSAPELVSAYSYNDLYQQSYMPTQPTYTSPSSSYSSYTTPSSYSSYTTPSSTYQPYNTPTIPTWSPPSPPTIPTWTPPAPPTIPSWSPTYTTPTYESYTTPTYESYTTPTYESYTTPTNSTYTPTYQTPIYTTPTYNFNTVPTNQTYTPTYQTPIYTTPTYNFNTQPTTTPTYEGYTSLFSTPEPAIPFWTPPPSEPIFPTETTGYTAPIIPEAQNFTTTYNGTTWNGIAPTLMTNTTPTWVPEPTATSVWINTDVNNQKYLQQNQLMFWSFAEQEDEFTTESP